MERILLSEKEAAEYIGISISLLRQARRGCFKDQPNRIQAPPYIKLGRIIRYKITDIDKWIEDKRVV